MNNKFKLVSIFLTTFSLSILIFSEDISYKLLITLIILTATMILLDINTYLFENKKTKDNYLDYHYYKFKD